MALEHCLGLSHQSFGLRDAYAQCLLACFDLARLLLTTFRTLLPVRHWSKTAVGPISSERCDECRLTIPSRRTFSRSIMTVATFACSTEARSTRSRRKTSLDCDCAKSLVVAASSIIRKQLRLLGREQRSSWRAQLVALRAQLEEFAGDEVNHRLAIDRLIARR